MATLLPDGSEMKMTQDRQPIETYLISSAFTDEKINN
jgi:hypothetical protein